MEGPLAEWGSLRKNETSGNQKQGVVAIGEGPMRSTDRIGAGPYARLAETPRRKAGALSYANTKNLPEAEIHR